MAPRGTGTVVRALRVSQRGLGRLDRLARKAAAGPITRAALDRVQERLRVVDVGAQALGYEAHVYAPLAAATQVEVVGFDPLEARMHERAAKDGTAVTLLPHALGDGRSHTLYVNNEDSTSSLLPLNSQYLAHFEHLHTLETVQTLEVETRRLDDVLPAGRVAFLKLDVQGAELMVLQNGPRTLADTAVVHCEVEFSPLYEDQPLYADVEQELKRADFYLVDLLVPHRYSYSGATRTSDQLLWADAVFFKATDDRSVRSVQALIAATVYGKLSLAEHLLKG